MFESKLSKFQPVTLFSFFPNNQTTRKYTNPKKFPITNNKIFPNTTTNTIHKNPSSRSKQKIIKNPQNYIINIKASNNIFYLKKNTYPNITTSTNLDTTNTTTKTRNSKIFRPAAKTTHNFYKDLHNKYSKNKKNKLNQFISDYANGINLFEKVKNKNGFSFENKFKQKPLFEDFIYKFESKIQKTLNQKNNILYYQNNIHVIDNSNNFNHNNNKVPNNYIFYNTHRNFFTNGIINKTNSPKNKKRKITENNYLDNNNNDMESNARSSNFFNNNLIFSAKVKEEEFSNSNKKNSNKYYRFKSKNAILCKDKEIINSEINNNIRKVSTEPCNNNYNKLNNSKNNDNNFKQPPKLFLRIFDNNNVINNKDENNKNINKNNIEEKKYKNNIEEKKDKNKNIEEKKYKNNIEEKKDKSNNIEEKKDKNNIEEKKDKNNFSSNYEIFDLLGKGAYASVKMAISKLNHEKYAVKIYDKKKIKDENKKKYIYREIEILKRINHPNIAKYIDSIETSNEIFIIQELITGISLRDYYNKEIRNQKGISEHKSKVFRKIFYQIFDAFNYLHKNKISHRDIKLENILMCKGHIIKIIDFGFGVYNPDSKFQYSFCGTPNYMPPEIVMKKKYIGEKADLWSLGILLYKIYCADFPFKGKDEKDLYRNIVKCKFKIVDYVPNEVKEVINEMIVFEPCKRLTCEEVLNSKWMKG